MFQFLLQNVTVLLQNAAVITKCDVYFKMSWYRDSSIRLLQTSIPWQPVSL